MTRRSLPQKLVFKSCHFPESSKNYQSFRRSCKELFTGFLSSMILLLPAFLGSLILGIGGGLFFGLHQRIRRIFLPYVHVLSSLPPTLFFPDAIALLPSFKAVLVFLIFLGSFWPIFLGTYKEFCSLKNIILDNVRTLGLKGNDFLLKVIIPAASPYIISGAV